MDRTLLSCLRSCCSICKPQTFCILLPSKNSRECSMQVGGSSWLASIHQGIFVFVFVLFESLTHRQWENLLPDIRLESVLRRSCDLSLTYRLFITGMMLLFFGVLLLGRAQHSCLECCTNGLPRELRRVRKRANECIWRSMSCISSPPARTDERQHHLGSSVQDTVQSDLQFDSGSQNWRSVLRQPAVPDLAYTVCVYVCLKQMMPAFDYDSLNHVMPV